MRRQRGGRRGRIGEAAGGGLGTIVTSSLLFGDLDALLTTTKLVLVVDEARRARGGTHLVGRSGRESSAVGVGVLDARGVATGASDLRGHLGNSGHGGCGLGSWERRADGGSCARMGGQSLAAGRAYVGSPGGVSSATTGVRTCQSGQV